MDRHDLTDMEWNAIRKYLPAERPRRPGRTWCSHRTVINGILWILAAGAPWRDLPERYGNWSTVYKRFVRWRKSGIWDRIYMNVLRSLDRELDIDDSLWCVDGTIVRAHRSAAGSRSSEATEPTNHALGRSQGGFSTKIHMLTSGQGIPLAFVLTPGQAHESRSLESLFEQQLLAKTRKPKALAGDKAYSSNKIRTKLLSQGVKDVIPTRSTEKRNAKFPKATYRKRNIVERVFGWLKENRRIATRYEKQANNYLAFLKIASTRMLLNWH